MILEPENQYFVVKMENLHERIINFIIVIALGREGEKWEKGMLRS